MSHATSPFAKRRYRVVRVTREWEMARSSFYYQLHVAAQPERALQRRGEDRLERRRAARKDPPAAPRARSRCMNTVNSLSKQSGAKQVNPAPDSPVIQNILNLAAHPIADSLNPSFCLRIQPIDKVSESRNFFFNSQIAIGLGSRRGYTVNGSNQDQPT